MRSLLCLLALIPLVLSSGCVQHGMRDYDKTSGAKGEAMGLARAINADLVGVKELPTSQGTIIFSEGVLGTRRIPILNKSRDAVIGYSEEPVLAGLYVTEPTRAWGDAFSKSFRSIGAVAGTAFAGMAGIAAAQSSGSAITSLATGQ